MNVEYIYYGALRFCSKIQGTFMRCGVTQNHFGDLSCCQGKVNGITDYNLSDNLSDLYTLKHVLSKPFLNNARTQNNDIAMISLTATQGLKSQTHNNKQILCLLHKINCFGELDH